MKSIECLIASWAESNPDKVAVKSGGLSITYRELWQAILAAERYFENIHNYQRGRTVILSAGKQIEFVYAYFGAHMAGLVVVPVAEDINQTRFAYICEAVKPIVVIGFDHIETSIPKAPLAAFGESLGFLCRATNFPRPNDVADILFTTGTTGAPKGVPLTFANEMAAAQQINDFVQNGHDDIELLALPVSHSFGLGRLRCCLANGQTIVLLGSFANVKRIFRTIESEKITGFTMVPASWKFLQKMVGDSLSQFANQLRYIEMGSAYFAEEDKRHLARLFPKTRVTMHYGLTEASRSAFMEFHEDDAALASVGKPSPGVEIDIFDEHGNKLPPEAEGEICIKGAHVMRGYLANDNSQTFFGDYFRTGDCGTMTKGGYIYLKSRLKELVNVGGKKVAPAEVDEQILKISGVSDCACVGIPDPEGVMGEVVKGCVVRDKNSRLTFEQIAAALFDKIENYKIPVVWQWIDQVPRTHNGKIQRGLLK